MSRKNVRWWMILSCWSCAACAAWAQAPVVSPPAPPLEPLPSDRTVVEERVADASAAEVVPCTESTYVAEYHSGSGPLAWWRNRLKPALQYKYWGYPEEFEEVPQGARVRAAQRAQICNAWGARLWLYRYDFCGEGAGLNPAGDKRVRDLAAEFSVWAHHPVVIESTGNPDLDAARRAEVAKRFEEFGAPAQVVVDVARVAAPFGDETRWWYQRFERQVQSGGGSSATTGSGGGAAAMPGR